MKRTPAPRFPPDRRSRHRASRPERASGLSSPGSIMASGSAPASLSPSSIVRRAAWRSTAAALRAGRSRAAGISARARLHRGLLRVPVCGRDRGAGAPANARTLPRSCSASCKTRGARRVVARRGGGAHGAGDRALLEGLHWMTPSLSAEVPPSSGTRARVVEDIAFPTHLGFHRRSEGRNGQPCEPAGQCRAGPGCMGWSRATPSSRGCRRIMTSA